MQALGISHSSRRVFWPAAFFLGLVALPFTVFLFYIASGVAEISYWLMTIAIVLLLWFFILRRLHTVYTFPLIQFDDNFIVVCDPISRRRVYNRACINRQKKWMKSVYFTHNGWPVLINLHTLSEKEREIFWRVLNDV